MSKKKKKKSKTLYPHNPSYSMIVPDAKNIDEEVVSTGES